MCFANSLFTEPEANNDIFTFFLLVKVSIPTNKPGFIYFYIRTKTGFGNTEAMPCARRRSLP